MKIVARIASVALLATLAVPALAQNLVANGSFENQGEVDNWYVFDGWTLGGTDGDSPLRPPARIYYNNSGDYPNGAYNEAIPVNNAFTISPDAAGQRAAYFVSDFAGPQTLSQMLHLMPGTYEIGFSAYAPANGYANAGDARFTGEILGVTLANYLVSTGPATTWQTFSGTTTIAAEGDYDVKFSFFTDLYPSKDVVIDQVYVMAVPVPEPGTWALLLGGLGFIGFVARRRLSAQDQGPMAA